MMARKVNKLAKHHQQGQALMEFLVVAVALLPLFLLLPIIAKYQDIAHSTLIASRYAAFDDMVRNATQNSQKPIEQLQDEVRRRFFSSSTAPIKTNDVAGNFKAHQNLFWRTPNDQSLIAKFDDVLVQRSNKDGMDAYGFMHKFGGSGISTTNVSVKLANLPANLEFYKPFDTINLVMQRSTSVVTDGWSGRNPVDVDNKVLEIKPYFELFSLLSIVIDPLVKLLEPGVDPPNLGKLDFWRDDVPADRVIKK
jgi:hypothetical protein